jgi:hypothetical protein
MRRAILTLALAAGLTVGAQAAQAKPNTVSGSAAVRAQAQQAIRKAQQHYAVQKLQFNAKTAQVYTATLTWDYACQGYAQTVAWWFESNRWYSGRTVTGGAGNPATGPGQEGRSYPRSDVWWHCNNFEFASPAVSGLQYVQVTSEVAGQDKSPSWSGITGSIITCERLYPTSGPIVKIGISTPDGCDQDG